MHGLDYIHGDLKSVRVSSDSITSGVEASSSSTFSLTTTTLPVSRILDRRLSSRRQSLVREYFQPLKKVMLSRYGGSLRNSSFRKSSD